MSNYTELVSLFLFSLQFIRKNRPKPLSYEEALEQVKREERWQYERFFSFVTLTEAVVPWKPQLQRCHQHYKTLKLFWICSTLWHALWNLDYKTRIPAIGFKSDQLNFALLFDISFAVKFERDFTAVQPRCFPRIYKQLRRNSFGTGRTNAALTCIWPEWSFLN